MIEVPSVHDRRQCSETKTHLVTSCPEDRETHHDNSNASAHLHVDAHRVAELPTRLLSQSQLETMLHRSDSGIEAQQIHERSPGKIGAMFARARRASSDIMTLLRSWNRNFQAKICVPPRSWIGLAALIIFLFFAFISIHVVREPVISIQEDIGRENSQLVLESTDSSVKYDGGIGFDSTEAHYEMTPVSFAEQTIEQRHPRRHREGRKRPISGPSLWMGPEIGRSSQPRAGLESLSENSIKHQDSHRPSDSEGPSITIAAAALFSGRYLEALHLYRQLSDSAPDTRAYATLVHILTRDVCNKRAATEDPCES